MIFIKKILVLLLILCLLLSPRKNLNSDEIIIEIKDLGLVENVFQANDNQYYLEHDRFLKKSVKGELFLDYRTNINSKKVIIYGHNSMTYDVPFKKLEKYYEENFFKNSGNIKLLYNGKVYEYEVFAVFVEYSDWSYLKLYNDDSSFLKHLEYLKNKSWYDKEVVFNNDDKIIILQTCSYHKNFKKYKTKYLVIVGLLK